MKDPAVLKEEIAALFASQYLAVLATDGPGHRPYTSLLAFAAADDLSRLLFATPRDTRKFANMADNAGVSLLVDSRINSLSDFRDAVAVTATGTATEATGPDRDRLLPVFLGKHPHLKQFVADPDSALMVVAVDSYVMVSRFQDVETLNMR